MIAPAVGTLSATDPYTAELVPYMDNNLAPAAGKAHLRFIHLVPDAPGVDVGVQGGPTLFTNTLYLGASAYLPVDAGMYDLEASVTGGGPVIVTMDNVVLIEGVIYDAIAVGSAGSQVNVVLSPVNTLWLPLIVCNP